MESERRRAASAAYTATIVDLRLREGGGFKIASQQRRAVEAALDAADAVDPLRNPSEDLVDEIADILAYMRAKENNPKAADPIKGFLQFSEEQREFLKEQQRANAVMLLTAITKRP